MCILMLCLQIYRIVCKLGYGETWWSTTVVTNHGDRRQSVSRQPSFTLSEWTDAQEDLMDLEAEPQTPVFDLGLDTRTEGDITTLSVTPVGLQERSVGGWRWRGGIQGGSVCVCTIAIHFSCTL